MQGVKAGFHFRERMSGWVSTIARHDPEQGARQAEADRQWAEVVLDIEYPDLDEVLRAGDARASVRGSALVAGLSPVVMQIVDGSLELFVHHPDRVATWQMEYVLRLRDQDGTAFTLRGVKHLQRDSVFAAWRRTTTLYTTVTEDAGGTTVAAGILHLTLPDFVRELRTMHLTNTPSRWKRMTGLVRFFAMFLAMMLRLFGGVIGGEPWAFPPPRPPTPGRPPRPALTLWCTGPASQPTWREESSPDAWLRLTRYHGGTKGPILLAPGFGMGTEAYVTDTIDTNLTEFLVGAGYDVWLFDYRASPSLASSHGKFTIDDVAREDWPVAVKEVCRYTGSPQVQVFAHCVGSMSFQMAMLWEGNAEMRDQVRAAVCSQVTVHPVSTWFNTFKVRARLGPVLERLEPVIQPDGTRTFGHVLYDLVLRIAPTPRGEACGNAVCQWITAYFGLTHRHAQLNDATHDDLGRLFGASSIHALRHIGDMVAARKSLDHEGNDVYVGSDRADQPGNADRLRIPILFLAGRHNRIFFPETSARTIDWLRTSNPDVSYERHLFADYAHLDGIVGRTADQDVFPVVVDHLDAYPVS